MDVKIIVAAHKAYRMPEGDIYLPVQVGAYRKPSIGYARDDSGDHISGKNPSYCELTGLYWLWKNVNAEYYGLVHYRRLFANPGLRIPSKDFYSAVLDGPHLERILRETDIVLPRKRNYFIETIYSHYAHTHYHEHLDVTRQVLLKRCPEYVPAFDALMRGRTAHMFNMMIMSREKFFAYCTWLFPILEEVAPQFSGEDYASFQKRYIGRLGELLLNVWVNANEYPFQTLPVIMTEKVHWPKKICAFLAAKFLGRRYSGSF